MKSNWVLAAWALILAIILFLSDRPWGLVDRLRVDEIAALGETPQFAEARRRTEIGSGIVTWLPGESHPMLGMDPPLKLGWVYREVSLLRMPFWTSADAGFVTYLELPEGIQMATLDPAQLAQIERASARDYSSEYGFAWYLHFWGWLVLLGLVVAVVLNRLEARHRTWR